TCPETYDAATDTVNTPNYPSNYSQYADCTWTITSLDEEKSVTVTFTDFTLESEKFCEKDYVQLFDDNSMDL
ncbi:Ovochymase-1, partial [Cichlidogyrus casuarinus]